MSEQNKIYVPKSGAKEITFQSGKKILKLNFKANELIAFLNQHKNDKGYVTLGVSERREVGQYGDTHCVWLDTWKPQPRGDQQQQRTPSRPTSPPPTESDEPPF